MDNKIIIKSGIEFQYFIIVLFFIYIIYSSLTILLLSTMLSRIIIYVFIFSLIYISLCLLINQYRFYEDKFEIIYFFRVINRCYEHSYDEVFSVKYYNFTSKYSFPTIQILLSNYKYKTVLPFNSFPVYSFKKRAYILKFLKIKGMQIEIHSSYDKDKDILS